jgi:hypothetical protein
MKVADKPSALNRSYQTDSTSFGVQVHWRGHQISNRFHVIASIAARG